MYVIARDQGRRVITMNDANHALRLAVAEPVGMRMDREVPIYGYEAAFNATRTVRRKRKSR